MRDRRITFLTTIILIIIINKKVEKTITAARTQEKVGPKAS
jgi:hypothetical protein